MTVSDKDMSLLMMKQNNEMLRQIVLPGITFLNFPECRALFDGNVQVLGALRSYKLDKFCLKLSESEVKELLRKTGAHQNNNKQIGSYLRLELARLKILFGAGSGSINFHNLYTQLFEMGWWGTADLVILKQVPINYQRTLTDTGLRVALEPLWELVGARTRHTMAAEWHIHHSFECENECNALMA